MNKIIFQNDYFIIVDKPSNVLSVPSRIGDKDNRPCLGTYLQNELKRQIYPVHRLDFEVSGLIMYALGPDSQRFSNLWFENKLIFKTYEALTQPIADQEYKINEMQSWECMIMKGKKRAYEAPFGKKSITHATLIEKNQNGIFRWHLNPITGRSHQLRFELFRHNHPIIGDALYGSKAEYKSGIALRAFKIDFTNCPESEKFGLPKEIKILGL